MLEIESASFKMIVVDLGSVWQHTLCHDDFTSVEKSSLSGFINNKAMVITINAQFTKALDWFLGFIHTSITVHSSERLKLDKRTWIDLKGYL